MTEQDVVEYIDQDKQVILAAIGQAKSPTDVYRLVAQAIVARVGLLDYGRCARTVAAILQRPYNAGSLSDHVAHVCIEILTAVSSRLPPEDLLAAMLWLAGNSEIGAGVIQAVFEAVPDTGAQEAAQRLEARVTTLRGDLVHRDTKVFDEGLRRLPMALQQVIRGRLLDARWSFNEGDGESYRHSVVTARALAEKYLRAQQRAQA